eukprot:2569242-Rhodomonas_salina.2
MRSESQCQRVRCHAALTVRAWQTSTLAVSFGASLVPCQCFTPTAHVAVSGSASSWHHHQ